LLLLQRFGVVADNVLGHSLGELSSLYWAGGNFSLVAGSALRIRLK
jgi:malonyl CoA-acyl carrier protein transacylase